MTPSEANRLRDQIVHSGDADAATLERLANWLAWWHALRDVLNPEAEA